MRRWMPKLSSRFCRPPPRPTTGARSFCATRASRQTFTDYVLVSQDEPFVEHRARQPNAQWLLTTVMGLESSLRLASVDCLLRLAEIYDRVVFPPPESEDGGSLRAS
jgi:hypothetical protein